uniref:4-alpha-glucanotransferase n=1 Tax=Desulfobacca acetoxidans TaxID=60893 RepID=A0A7C3UZ77_9BACT
MAGSDLRTLAQVCGIARDFRDNFGTYRRTSRATMEALLTAMEIPCGSPAEVRESLDLCRQGRTRRLLPPMSVVTPRTDRRLLFNLWWPRPEIPGGIEMVGELVGEGAEKREWFPHASQLSLDEAQTTADGCCLTLSLPLPADLAEGYYDLTFSAKAAGREITGATCLAVCPGQAWLPPLLDQGARLWGLNLPLYALRSLKNWGIGDFADLRAALAWAGELGASFVGVNPLHALLSGAKADPSPYSPSSRLFLNFLYVSLESVPEIKESAEAQILLANQDFQADLNRLRNSPLVAYPKVRHLKLKFFRFLFDAFAKGHGLPEAPRTSRGRQFARFVEENGETLRNFALFQALGDHQPKKDWRRWPQNLQRPDTPAVAAFAREHRRDLAFYQYIQWLAAEQRQEVWDAATRAGLPFTLYQDLALGAAPHGFETWGHPGLFAHGASMGAPPDAFNLKGQDWGLPPLIPRRLEESGYRLFIDILRANLPPGGIVRLDHVMGLFRLYWIPQGLDPQEGAYVRYPARDLLGLLALESQRRQTLVIGEDLGTVPASIRRELARHRIFSYRVFYFERDWEGDQHFIPPEDYPRLSLACATTHDLPTLAGYWEGRDLILKNQLNLYPSPQMAKQDALCRSRDRLLLVAALIREGLLPPNFSPPVHFCPDELREAVLAYLGESQAALVEARLEDLLGLTAQQNLPGTTRQHPNWQQKIFQTLEDLRRNPEVIRLAETLRRARNQNKNI